MTLEPPSSFKNGPLDWKSSTLTTRIKNNEKYYTLASYSKVRYFYMLAVGLINCQVFNLHFLFLFYPEIVIISNEISVCWFIWKCCLPTKSLNFIFSSSKHEELTSSYVFIYAFTSCFIVFILSQKSCQKWKLEKKIVEGWPYRVFSTVGGMKQLFAHILICAISALCQYVQSQHWFPVSWDWYMSGCLGLAR